MDSFLRHPVFLNHIHINSCFLITTLWSIETTHSRFVVLVIFLSIPSDKSATVRQAQRRMSIQDSAEDRGVVAFGHLGRHGVGYMHPSFLSSKAM